MPQAIIEINGKKYMNTKTAADIWGLNAKTVSDYCKNDKLFDKFKDGSGKWYIYVDELKPLKNEEIRRLLVLTLMLKNKPTLEIDWSTFSFDDSKIEVIYKSLVMQHLIEDFCIQDKKRIPYEVVLTEKGMNVVIIGSKRKDTSFLAVMQQWLPIVIQLAQFSVQLYRAI